MRPASNNHRATEVGTKIRTRVMIGLCVCLTLGVSASPTSSSEVLTNSLALPGQPDGAVPDGCHPALTGGGGPAKWEVSHVDGQPVIVDISREPVDDRFPVCIVNDVTATDIELSVAFELLEGTIDQAAGLIFRVQDKDNYYVARANALEGNVNLYHVVHGIRWQFAGADAQVTRGTVQRLGVRVVGDLITVFLGGKPLFEARDRTFVGPGKIGVWTKADSLTAFSGLHVTILKE